MIGVASNGSKGAPATTRSLSSSVTAPPAQTIILTYYACAHQLPIILYFTPLYDSSLNSRFPSVNTELTTTMTHFLVM